MALAAGIAFGPPLVSGLCIIAIGVGIIFGWRPLSEVGGSLSWQPWNIPARPLFAAFGLLVVIDGISRAVS